MARFKPARHDDQLSIVDHLDELRTRLFIAGAAFVVAFALSMWQNHEILRVVNDPLPRDIEPLTLSPAEPFITTVTVAAYAGILLALPVILYQLYAFVLPAFTPTERRVAFPLLMMVPFLFIAGVVFGYFVVLPAAINFLLNFNSDQFNIQIRARDYFGFVGMTLISMGLIFQVPVGILALTRLGVTSVEQLRRNRRVAVVLCAVTAALLPGQDPVTMVLIMVPLYLLYETSIVLARFFGTPRSALEEAEPEGSSP